jgi:hypothetical protein
LHQISAQLFVILPFPFFHEHQTNSLSSLKGNLCEGHLRDFLRIIFLGNWSHFGGKTNNHSVANPQKEMSFQGTVIGFASFQFAEYLQSSNQLLIFA